MPRILLLSESFESARCHCVAAEVGAAIATGAASLGGSIVAGIANKRQQDRANALNREYAEKNYQLQARELEYQHALQQQIFDREDTAYQRTVADMRKAGMSPLAMSGTDNAGEAISTTAPQYNYEAKADTTTSQILSQAIPQAISSISNIVSLRNQAAQNSLLEEQARKLRIENDYQEKNYASTQDKQSELLDQQVRSLTQANDESEQTFEDRKARIKADLQAVLDSNRFQSATYDSRVNMITEQLESQRKSNKMSDNEIRQMARDLSYQETYGIVDDMSDDEKLIRLLAPVLGVDFGAGTSERPWKSLDSFSSEFLRQLSDSPLGRARDRWNNFDFSDSVRSVLDRILHRRSHSSGRF